MPVKSIRYVESGQLAWRKERLSFFQEELIIFGIFRKVNENQALRLQIEGALCGLTGGRVPFPGKRLLLLAQTCHFVDQDIRPLQI